MSLILEATFAGSFEARGKALEYEIAQIEGALSTIDFRRTNLAGTRYNFEMRVLQERAAVVDSIRAQIACAGSFAIHLDGDGQQDEILRLQSTILSKCQDEDGRPIKFLTVTPGEYNFIAVDISDILLGTQDELDCALTMGGDQSVPSFAQRDVFGLFQLPSAATMEQEDLARRVEHVRKMIHGVLFLRRTLRHTPLNFELRRFLVLNSNLPMPDVDRNELLGELRAAMQGWSDQRHRT